MIRKAIAACALVALCGVGAWWLLGSDDLGSATPPDPVSAASAASTPVPRQRSKSLPDAAAEIATVPGTSSREHADCWIVGRVVGEGRYPASSVDVELFASSVTTSRGMTDSAGHFRLSARTPDEGTLAVAVVARSRDGRAASSCAYLNPDSQGEITTGTLALGPAAGLDVVVREGEVPAAGVLVSVGQYFTVRTATTDAEGRVRFDSLPEGTYTVAAGDPAKGHAVLESVVPRKDGPLALTLTRRDIRVSVVRKGSRAPVVGAEIGAAYRVASRSNYTHERRYEPPLGGSTTGPDGVAILRGAGRDESVRLSVRRMPQSTVAPPRAEVSCDAGQTEAVLEIPAPRTYRFHILIGEVPAPPDGTVLDLVPLTNSGSSVPATTAWVEDGDIVVVADHADFVNCFARAPDGSIALLRADPKGPAADDTSFRAERKIEVVLRTSDGRPASGVTVVARTQGNNQIAAPVVTGADGIATIRGLYGWRAEVYFVSDANPWGTRIGGVDLDRGSGHLDFTASRETRVVLRIRIDGHPALPRKFSVWGASVVDEDAGAGTIAVAVPPAAAGSITTLRFMAAGYQECDPEVPAGAIDGVEIPIDLRPGGVLTARVIERPGSHARIELQRWAPESNGWTRSTLGSEVNFDGEVTQGAIGDVRIGGLAPGRYRLVDGESHVATAPVEVVAGETADMRTFDLSRSGRVLGHVIAPGEDSLGRARVVVEEPGSDCTGNGAGGEEVAVDGSFSVRVPGDRTVRLRVVHPTLRPAAVGGTVDVVAPREGIELRLERAPVVTLRAQEAIRSTASLPVRVLVFAGEPAGAPVADVIAAVEDGALQFAAPPPGRWTLWIDVSPWAPLVLRGVEVAQQDLDLGMQTFPVGSGIRPKVVLRERNAATRIYVWARAMGSPPYTRWIDESADRPVLLQGLGPGRFNVTIQFTTGLPVPITRTIDVDGSETTVVPIDVDLR